MEQVSPVDRQRLLPTCRECSATVAMGMSAAQDRFVLLTVLKRGCSLMKSFMTITAFLLACREVR